MLYYNPLVYEFVPGTQVNDIYTIGKRGKINIQLQACHVEILMLFYNCSHFVYNSIRHRCIVMFKPECYQIGCRVRIHFYRQFMRNRLLLGNT